MYRVTGIGTSLVFIAAGAILAWAVEVDADGFDVNAIGIILFVVGLVGLALTLLLGALPVRDRDTTVVDRGTTYVESPPRERVVERERQHFSDF
jgi:homogentisate 1,2-dioxygenase